VIVLVHTLALHMKRFAGREVKRSASRAQGPEAETLRRWKFHPPLVLLSCLLIGAVPTTDIIEWRAARPLHWSDYKGNVPYPTKHGAATAIEVRSSNAFPDWNHVTYDVTCVVIKSGSWVKPELRADSALLNHERRHFDLAECSARTLRSILQKESVSIQECNQRLQVLRDSMYAAWVGIDTRYDLETAHGTIAQEQERWAKKIAHTLDSLSAYTEPHFVVELKR
jgi:hypothetical protein